MEKIKFEVRDNLPVRYRPRNLDEVIGNIPVKRVLRGYLQTGTLPTALMFIGRTGSGKTTLAEILALTVNCNNPRSDHSPCGECASCKIPIGENHPCIHLVDCTVKGVNDIKEIIKISNLAPPFNCRVNILDEIQDAKYAQKALLKPLEKSPPRTMWILCTTEPDHILEALIGRCVQLNLKYPSAYVMSKRLKAIAKSEFEPPLAKILFPYLKKIAKIWECQPRKSIELMEEIAMALLGSKKALKDPDSAERIIRGFIGKP